MNRTFMFLKSDNGTTSIEYALMASLIAMAIVGSVTVLGGSVRSLYQSVVNAFP